MKQDKSLKELEAWDKRLRHPPVKLYCMGCGKLIHSSFTGGLWSYTCGYCHSTVFGSIERGLMIPSSIICGYKSFSRCKECKSEEEHIKKVLQGCLGKDYKKIKLSGSLKRLRDRAICEITLFSSKQYGKDIEELNKLEEEYLKGGGKKNAKRKI